ncbi:MAG: glutamine synthetase III [Oscillospiraceae bacterium]|nr:glutamine synthetase III [Oscillospiraceae bacterium]
MKENNERVNVAEIFGSQVFNDTVMRHRLPKAVYQSLMKTSSQGQTLDPAIADIVANAMKDWAIEQGATHYAHWFQPMNNSTAGKHDAFLSTAGEGTVTLEFSSTALVKGETDSSSFPSGGLRSTFEARGYTAWDPTSPAFVRDGTLYIPTAFCSYTGEAMDTKTPLLRSMQALSKEGVRFLHALGMTDVNKISPTVGAEQEYFLVDYERYSQRLDLKICGRTLFGAKPSKGQDLDDHYCGRIRLRVADFMRDLDMQLWKLGIVSKTKHNEAAPAQHELAAEYSTANIACDNNQLVMEIMRSLAKEHGLACLLHEKPFANVNGSGKHNNYSLVTDTGVNLLDPGKNPEENSLFLLMLCAFIRGVDLYGDLLRMSATCPGNDYRLGEGEAPPAVISIFLGSNLYSALNNIARGTLGSHNPEKQFMDVGVEAIPQFQMDESDRNRTSPFAFTGNKFEFRMVGSSQSLAYANVVLNTMIADSFSTFSNRLEQADDIELETQSIIADTMRDHKRILFNGNNYNQEWIEEAQRRGLPIIRNAVEAYRTFIDPKNIDLFSRFHVFSDKECHARYEVLVENYAKVRRIEASTMLEMVKRQILPACIEYAGRVAGSFNNIQSAGLTAPAIGGHVQVVTSGIEGIIESVAELDAMVAKEDSMENAEEQALFSSTQLRQSMDELRRKCDALESIVDARNWPMPTYTDLLHRV